jgi:hypothetical protein
LRISPEGESFLPDGVQVTLKATGLYEFNSMSNPQNIFPTGRSVAFTGKKIDLYLDPISVNVVILNYKK